VDYVNIDAALKEAMAIDGAVSVCPADWEQRLPKPHILHIRPKPADVPRSMRPTTALQRLP
jgi:hypothetical protein